MLTDAGCKAGQGAGEQPWVSATTGVTSVPSKGLTWGAGTPTARPDVTSQGNPAFSKALLCALCLCTFIYTSMDSHVHWGKT